MDTGLTIIIVITIAIFFILLSYYFIKWRMESRFCHWLEVEQQVLEQERGRIRKEAVIQSRAVLHLVGQSHQARFAPAGSPVRRGYHQGRQGDGDAVSACVHYHTVVVR